MDESGKLLDLIAKRRGGLARPLVVGISGIECSGKSTLAAALRDRLERAGLATHLESIDDFLNPKALRHAGEDQAAAYYDNTFRLRDLTAQIISPIIECGRIEGNVDHHDFTTDRVISRPISVGPLDVLIVEGVFLFRPPLLGFLDLKIWVEIGFGAALERAKRRALEIERYGPEHIARRYRDRYFPAQRRHLEEDRPLSVADHVVCAAALAAR